MTHTSTLLPLPPLAARLSQLREAAIAHADAIAMDPDNRATGKIVTSRTAGGWLLAPAAKRWRIGDRIGVSVGAHVTRATIRLIHDETRTAAAQPERSIPSGHGLAATEYEVLHRTIALRLEPIVADALAGRTTIACENAAVLLGLIGPRRPPVVIPDDVRAACEGYLSVEQSVAWATATQQDVCILAPPGVGKTVVLGTIGAALSAAGRPVALVAPTHQALALLREAQVRASRFIQSATSPVNRGRPGSVSHMTLAAAFMRVGAVPTGAAVVVDEVSAASLPALVAGLSTAGHIVVGGDLLQLGPVVSAAQWVREISAAPPFGADPISPTAQAAVVRLRESRRLPAPIATLLRDVAYGPGGPTGHAAQDGPLQASPLEGALTIVDVAGVAAAEATTKLYSTLHRLAQRSPASDEAPSWLAITPTHARAEALSPHAAGMLHVSTVHAAQGREAPVVVLDLIGEPAARPWYAASGPLDEGGRMLTVALSRASRHTIVALDLPRFLRGPGSHWARALRTAIESGAGRVVPVGGLDIG